MASGDGTSAVSTTCCCSTPSGPRQTRRVLKPGGVALAVGRPRAQPVDEGRARCAGGTGAGATAVPDGPGPSAGLRGGGRRAPRDGRLQASRSRGWTSSWPPRPRCLVGAADAELTTTAEVVRAWRPPGTTNCVISSMRVLPLCARRRNARGARTGAGGGGSRVERPARAHARPQGFRLLLGHRHRQQHPGLTTTWCSRSRPWRSASPRSRRCCSPTRRPRSTSPTA